MTRKKFLCRLHFFRPIIRRENEKYTVPQTLAEEKILIGIKSDFITVNDGSVKFENTVIAIDDEEGSFAGYSALLPPCFLVK